MQDAAPAHTNKLGITQLRCSHVSFVNGLTQGMSNEECKERSSLFNPVRSMRGKIPKYFQSGVYYIA